MRFAAALSPDADPDVAARSACDEIARQLDGRAPDVVLVFASSEHADSAEPIAGVVADAFEPAGVAGCIARGILGGEREYEDVPSLALWAACMPEASIETFAVTADVDAHRTRFRLPRSVRGASAIIVLGDPATFPGGDFAESLHRFDPEIALVGGMTSGALGDGRGRAATRLILGREVLGEGAVCVAIAGDIAMTRVVAQGCRPFGRPLAITAAEATTIRELGGVRAVDALARELESLDIREREMFLEGLHVARFVGPRSIPAATGAWVVRHVVRIDESDGAIALSEPIRAGESIQFLIQDPDAARTDLERALADAMRGAPGEPAGALLFTCADRGRRLFGAPHHDAAAIARACGRVPLAGIFTAGELGPVGDASGLHQFAAVAALFGWVS